VIHVASIDLLWRASVRSIKGSVAAAMAIVRTQGFASIGFPVLGAGVGGFSEAEALALMQRALAAEPTTPAEVTIVRFRRPT
jgi:O-acetyl-ADP-ribose deacetylase (regulator of RNase III)